MMILVSQKDGKTSYVCNWRSRDLMNWPKESCIALSSVVYAELDKESWFLANFRKYFFKNAVFTILRIYFFLLQAQIKSPVEHFDHFATILVRRIQFQVPK